MITVSKYFGIEDWPPQPGGPTTRGQSWPQGGGVRIKDVFPVRNGHLTFTVEYEGCPTYDVHVKDGWREVELFQVLQQHVGKTIDEFGQATLSEAA
jgi:hypothetical protein